MKHTNDQRWRNKQDEPYLRVGNSLHNDKDDREAEIPGQKACVAETEQQRRQECHTRAAVTCLCRAARDQFFFKSRPSIKAQIKNKPLQDETFVAVRRFREAAPGGRHQ